ncbi:hypothetical protein FSP39_000153 [Pinctada imbricata]|uniref:Uncharacterized protein n=1 Tax=Pinctada imbricata TaxID=66713 RepID=A0AA88YGI5_PINIB|nr:hypothetical protein FSP39_000153 [Pinctada imbricata]
MRNTPLNFLIKSSNVVFTGGCIYHKSICRDKDAIEEMDKEIQRLKKEYDGLYVQSAEEWVKLRNASTNNGYVSFYVDRAVRSIQTLSELEEKISDELELKIPKVFAQWQASQNLTSEKFLELLIGRLDYSLADLKKMLEDSRNSQLIGLAVQFLVEATVNKFISSYKKAYNQIRTLQKEEVLGTSIWSALFSADADDAKVILDPNHPKYEEVMKKHGLKTSKISTKGKFKLVPKVFKQMYRNTKKYFSDKKAGIKKWGKIKSWKGFKGKLQHSMRGPISKMSKVKQFFTNSAARKFQVKSFKLGWSTRIMVGVGIIADALNTAITAVQWGKVADEMSKARKKYEEFLRDLRQEITNIKQEQANVSKEWNSVVESFKGLSKAFQELIQSANSNADFADVLGLPRLPVSLQMSIFSTNFDTVNKATTPAAQDAVISFLKDNDNNLTKIVDQMRARQTLYSGVSDKTNKAESIKEIFSDLIDIYNFDTSSTVRQFGQKLSKKDIVCSIAIMNRDVNEYDHFPLQTFRPRCDVSSTSFSSMELDATNKRNKEIMSSIVKREIEKDNTVSTTDLLGTVQNAYFVSKDQILIDFGNSLTEQDIVCSVATQFPAMGLFDLIDLTVFRPDCSAVSSAMFENLKQNANRLNSLNAEVESALNMCSSFGFCPCIPLMESQYSASESEIKAAIKRLRPDMKEYCGTTGCPCVPL